jgi:hypothetical protein
MSSDPSSDLDRSPADPSQSKQARPVDYPHRVVLKDRCANHPAIAGPSWLLT